MKPTALVTATGDAALGEPVLLQRSRALRAQRMERRATQRMQAAAEGRDRKGASGRTGSRLTIFCGATGVGSSLYFRALSGACDCDMFIARAVVGEDAGAGPGADDEGAVGMQ